MLLSFKGTLKSISLYYTLIKKIVLHLTKNVILIINTFLSPVKCNMISWNQLQNNNLTYKSLKIIILSGQHFRIQK